MAASCIASGEPAKLRSSEVGRSLPQFGATNETILRKIKDIFETKTVPALAALLGVTVKTARNRVERERKFTIDELATMMHSDHGWEVVAAIMADAPRPPQWWRICAPVMNAAEIRKMQMVAQRRVANALEDALDADQDLTAAIERAELLAIRATNEPRQMGHEARSSAGLRDRGMAAPAKARGKIPYAGRSR